MPKPGSSLSVRSRAETLRCGPPTAGISASVPEWHKMLGELRPVPIVATFALCVGPVLAQLAPLRESELSELIISGMAAMCMLSLGVVVLVRSAPVRLCFGLLPIAVFCAVLSVTHLAVHDDVQFPKHIALWIFGLALPVLLSATLGHDRAIHVVLGCVFAACLPSVLGSLIVPELLYVATNAYYTPMRSGWFYNPNTYGTVAFVLAATAATLFADDKRRVPVLRPLYGFVAVLSLVAIWNSRSRAAALALAVFMLVHLLMQLRIFWKAEKNRMMIVASVIAAIVLCSTFLVIVGAELFSTLEVQEFVTKGGRNHDLSSGRLDLWASAVHEWYRADSTFDALLGHGLGASTQLAAVAELGSLHNAYIKALFELGLIGALVLVGYAVALFASMAARALASGREAGLFALCIAIAVHSMFEAHLFNLGTTLSSVIFWSALSRLNR